MSLVTTTGDTSSLEKTSNIVGIFRLTSGRTVAFFFDSGTDLLSYTSSTDGLTWTAKHALPASIIPAALNAMDVIADKLHVFTGDVVIQNWKYDWDDALEQWTTSTTVAVKRETLPVHQKNMSVWWDAVSNVWRGAGYLTGGVSSYVQCWHVAEDGEWNGNDGSILYDLGTPTYPLHYVVNGVYHYIAAWSVSLGAYLLFPGTASGGFLTLTTAALEVIYAPDDGTEHPFEMFLEQDGTPSFIFQDGGELVFTHRGGVKTYSSPQVIAQAVEGDFTLTRDAATGHLFVTYPSIALDPSAPTLYMAQRLAIWRNPVAVNRTDDLVQTEPKAARYLQPDGVPVVYNDGTGTDVGYIVVGVGGQPQAPTLLSPVGIITTLTPTFVSEYNQPTPSDPLGASQIQVIRSSDSVVFWDSGTVTGMPLSVLYGSVGAAASALSYGDSFMWRRRDRDSISNGGAGTWGPWSNYLAFSTRHGATVTITDIVHDSGVTDTASPSDLGAPIFAVTATWAQGDGNDAAVYEHRLYDADDATLLTKERHIIAPVLANGGSITTTWQPVLDNGHTYHYALAMVNAESGAVTESAHWTLTTSWVPASPVTDLTFTSDNAHSRTHLTWALGGDTAGIRVEMQRTLQSGAVREWEQQYPDPTQATAPYGDLIAGIHLYPCPKFIYNYRVTPYNAAGTPGTPSVISGMLGLLGARLGGAVLLARDDPTNQIVLLGAPSDMSTLKFHAEEDFVMVVPLGSTKQVTAWGIVNYWSISGVSWYLSNTWHGGGEAIFAQDAYELLDAMRARHIPLLWRDIRGRSGMVSLSNFYPQEESGGAMSVAFDLHEVRYLGGPLAVPD